MVVKVGLSDAMEEREVTSQRGKRDCSKERLRGMQSLRPWKRGCLVDRDGGARGLDEAVVGGALAADGGVLAGVLDGDTDEEGDLLAVEADDTVNSLVEGQAEAGKGVLGGGALLDLRTALGDTGGALAVAVVLASREGRGDGGEGGNSGEDGLELHFEGEELVKLKS